MSILFFSLNFRIAINYINHLQKLLNDNVTGQNFITTEELGVRRRSGSYRCENRKTNYFQTTKEKFESVDEIRSTWTDGYIPNGTE